MTITTLNALIEAIKGGTPIKKILINETKSEKKDKKIAYIMDMCRKKGIALQRVPAQALDRKAGPDHQGVFAEISPVRFASLEEVLDNVRRGLILVLDGITDTGNMGAIIRSAVAAGVDAVIIPQRNSAPLNETVLKTSAGTLLKAVLVQVKNLNDTVKRLKEKDFWIVGADQKGTSPYYEYDFKYKTAIVLGSEHKGISPLLKKNADYLLTIPHSPQVESLNVSAAASVLLFEALRQNPPEWNIKK